MRIHWIDNLRGIAILLIVLGHTLLPEGSMVTKYLFSFHVVAFFILSGLLFNEQKHTKFVQFIKNKFLRLIVPFIFFNVFFILIYKLLGKFETTRFIDFAIGLGYGDYLGNNGGYIKNTSGFNIVNASTWFLPALFMTSAYYFVIQKLIPHRIIKLLFLFVLSILIYIESKYAVFRLPWSADIAVMMVVFYGWAHNFKKQIFKLVQSLTFSSLFLLIPIIGLHIILLNGVNVSTNDYGDYFGFIINSILGFATLLIISKNLGHNSLLSFIGKNSIIILGFEWIKEHVFGLSFGFFHYERGFSEAFFQFTMTIVLLIPIIIIVNKFFPFIIGTWYKKK